MGDTQVGWAWTGQELGSKFTLVSTEETNLTSREVQRPVGPTDQRAASAQAGL